MAVPLSTLTPPLPSCPQLPASSKVEYVGNAMEGGEGGGSEEGSGEWAERQEKEEEMVVERWIGQSNRRKRWRRQLRGGRERCHVDGVTGEEEDAAVDREEEKVTANRKKKQLVRGREPHDGKACSVDDSSLKKVRPHGLQLEPQQQPCQTDHAMCEEGLAGAPSELGVTSVSGAVSG